MDPMGNEYQNTLRETSGFRIEMSRIDSLKKGPSRYC